MVRRLALLAAVLFAAGTAHAQEYAQNLLRFVGPSAIGPTTGQVISVTIPSATFTSISDIYSAQTFMPHTLDIKFKGLTPAGLLANYAPGSFASPNFTFTATSPSHTVTTGGVSNTTIARSIVATQWLRQPCLGPSECIETSGYSPTEATSGSDAVTAWTANDYVFHDDTLGAISAQNGLYTGSGAVPSVLTTGVTPVNNNTITPPVPVCNWINPPGERIPNATFTVEVACYSAYAMNFSPVSGVQVDASDGTHTATKYVPYNAMANSQRFFSQSCTISGGSNVATCPDISGFIVGQRLRVAGTGGNIPGQPILATKTYTSGFAGTLTFSVPITVTTSAAGFETMTSTPAAGVALADGAFTNGAKIADVTGLGAGSFAVAAPSGTCTATCTSTTVTLSAPAQGEWAAGELLYTTRLCSGLPCSPQQWRISSQSTGTAGLGGNYVVNAACASCVTNDPIIGQPLSINVFTGAAPTSVGISINTSGASITAGAGHSATINQNYVGGVGDTVLVTTGVMPVYPAAFTTTDLASLTDGPIWFRFHAYPWVDAAASGSTLDSLMGADGTGCDWFYIYSNSQVCNASNAAWFGTNDIAHAGFVSLNLHNLWAYKDYAAAYAPKYVWVDGSSTGCVVQNTSTDPGTPATNYCNTVLAALTAIATSYGTGNANGGVVCMVAAGSPYSGSYGGVITGKIAANKPPWTLTSALRTGVAGTGGGGGTCPNFAIGTYAQNSDTTVAFTGNTGNLSPPGSITDNILFNGTGKVFQGNGTGAVINTGAPAFGTAYSQWNGLIYTPGANSPLIGFGTAKWDVFDSMVDEHSFDGNLFANFSGMTGGAGTVMGNTMVGGAFGTAIPTGKFLPRFAFGNHLFNPNIAGINDLSASATTVQSTSTMFCFNYYMGASSSLVLSSDYPYKNFVECNNIVEHNSDSTGSPSVFYSGDAGQSPAYNVVSARNIHVGSRANLMFNEQVPLPPTGSSNTTGNLGNGVYSVQATYALRGGGCPPTCTETATNGVSTTTKTITGGGVGTLTVGFPCDPNYVIYLYITCTPGGAPACTAGTSHAQTVAGTDASGEQLSACSIGNTNIAGLGSIIITKQGTAATPLINGPSVPAHGQLLQFFYKKFNIDFFSGVITDNTAHGAGTTANGSRVGNWAHMDQVGHIGNVWQGITTVSGSYFDAPCNLCTYPAFSSIGSGLSNWITYKGDRSAAEMNNSVYSTGTNTGEGNYCPDTVAGPNILIGLAAASNDFPIDMLGRTRPSTNDIPGPYTTGCN